MKELVKNILDEYLKIFPDEVERQSRFKEFLVNSDDKSVRDWNNFEGHIVTGAFVYSKLDNKFLMMYHKDLKMYLYPGGHVDSSDKTPLDGVLRETKEETGLDNMKVLSFSKDNNIPIDIDTQLVVYNERLNLPSHFHYDFRYLMIIDKIVDIKIDLNEHRDYKWISFDELKSMSRYSKVAIKLEKILKGVNDD